MTGTLPESIIRAITATTFTTRSLSIGVIVTVLLVALLVQKEVLRAGKHPRAEQWIDALNLAIAPLAVAWSFVIIMRLVELLTG